MIQGIYSATAGMVNQQTLLEVTTNNLANINTVGFKRDELSFSGMLNTLPVADSINVTNRPPKLDTVTYKFSTDFTQGSLRRTDNTFDLALDGTGFFAVQAPAGVRYTRSGNFFLDKTGQLVTADGYPVLGTNGPIQIRGTEAEIDGAGNIFVDGKQTAKLRLADFQDTSGLVKIGNNLLTNQNPGITEEVAAGHVRQGFLEMSNVDVVNEMARMIEIMRTYESYQKTIQLIDGTMQKANDELGKISV